jgi:hypothetical protein
MSINNNILFSKLTIMNSYIKKRTIHFLAILFSIGLLSWQQRDLDNTVFDDNIHHGIIFYEDGQFGGWPANHGIWSWGNEILVGFIQAEYREARGLHTYDPKTARVKYARSKRWRCHMDN